MSLLEISELAVEYPIGRGRPPLRAVDGVTLDVDAHETVGLVGESGSGKTTIGRALLGLAPVTAGRIVFDGADITLASRRERRALSAEMQMVFQDPYGSLNPTRSVGQTLAETLGVHLRGSRSQVEEQVRRVLERVGLPADAARRYPGSFSGGQRQRIAIARALIVEPRLVICDEPVSALDLSVQAQVLNLLKELQRDMRVGYLFISHDLAVVRHVSRRIVVLYRGRIVEHGDAADVYDVPLHPYTSSLLEAAPVPNPEAQRRRRSARRRQSTAEYGRDTHGCNFASHCPFVADICRVERPPLEAASARRAVACHRWRELQLGSSWAEATGAPAR